MSLYAHTVAPQPLEPYPRKKVSARSSRCNIGRGHLFVPTVVAPLKGRALPIPSPAVRNRATKIEALRCLHRLPPIGRKGGTGVVRETAYAAGDTLAVPRWFGTAAGTPHPGVINALNLRWILMILSGRDAYSFSLDRAAEADRINDVFAKSYQEGNMRRARIETATGLFSIPARVTTAMSMQSRLATACSYVSLLGFLGLFGYFVKGFGLYAKKGLEFRAAFPKNEPLHKQMAFLYDQVLLSDADMHEAMSNSIYNFDGGVLTQDEIDILMDHEKEAIRKEVQEKKSYRSFGRQLNEKEEELLVILLESEAAKIKHRKEAEYTRAVGPESLIAVKQYVAMDFLAQADEKKNGSKDPQAAERLLGRGFLKELEKGGLIAEGVARSVVDKAVKENRTNTAINTFVTVISILGIAAVIPLLVLKFALIDAWLWLIVGVAMLVVDLYFLGHTLLTQSPTKKEELSMLVMNLFAVSLGVAAFFMGAPLLGLIALGLQLVLVAYMYYQHRRKQLPAHFR